MGGCGGRDSREKKEKQTKSRSLVDIDILQSPEDRKTAQSTIGEASVDLPELISGKGTVFLLQTPHISDDPVRIQEMQTVQDCEDLDRAERIQEMRVVALIPAEASIFVLTGEDPGGDLIRLALHVREVLDEIHRHQRPVHTAHAEMLCDIVFEGVLFLSREGHTHPGLRGGMSGWEEKESEWCESRPYPGTGRIPCASSGRIAARNLLRSSCCLLLRRIPGTSSWLCEWLGGWMLE